MANSNVVLHSINSVDHSKCVDIFMRPDGTYGFEEFRHDFEDTQGWQAIGGFRTFIFFKEGEVLEAARRHVVWLTKV